MTRAREFDWLNQLNTNQKVMLNDMVRKGCIVRASNHMNSSVQVSVSFRGRVVAEAAGALLDEAFGKACVETHRVLFGTARADSRG